MVRKHQKRVMRTFLLTLVFTAAAVNASQTLVLCVGHDGHVAIEPAGHHHCTAEHGPTSDPADSHAHVADDHCRPCTDIPIPSWMGETTAGSPVTKSVGSTPMASFSLPHPAVDPPVLPALSGSPPPTYHAPLCTIVLLV